MVIKHSFPLSKGVSTVYFMKLVNQKLFHINPHCRGPCMWIHLAGTHTQNSSINSLLQIFATGQISKIKVENGHSKKTGIIIWHIEKDSFVKSHYMITMSCSD